MRKINQQQSYILDILFRNLTEDIENLHTGRSHLDAKCANNLYSIWKTKNNQLSKTVYKKPTALSSSEIEDLQKNGLVRLLGDRLEITSKGSNIIKTMILGNDISSFESKEDIDYSRAKKNIEARSRKNAEKQKEQEDNWWERFT
jgi:hypothetical protein